jgi:hypothetical protein
LTQLSLAPQKSQLRPPVPQSKSVLPGTQRPMGSQQPEQLPGPHSTQAPSWQRWPDEQKAHGPPLLPHCESSVPASQKVPKQQPAHAPQVPLATHLPLMQLLPEVQTEQEPPAEPQWASDWLAPATQVLRESQQPVQFEGVQLPGGGSTNTSLCSHAAAHNTSGTNRPILPTIRCRRGPLRTAFHGGLGRRHFFRHGVRIHGAMR